MKTKCLQVLEQIDECLKDDEFQVVLVMLLSKKLLKFFKGEGDRS